MVKYRRAEHLERGRSHRQGPQARLTSNSDSAEPRNPDDAADLQNAGDVGPSRRRSSRETVRKRTKASGLTTIASRTRQLPLAGTKRKRSSASPDQRGAPLGKRIADTVPKEQLLQVPGFDPDSQPFQAESGVSVSSAQTQQEQPTPDTVSKASLTHSRLCKSSHQSQGQGELASEEPNRQRRNAKRKASEIPAQDCRAPDSQQPAQDCCALADDQPAQDCCAAADEQPPDDAAFEAQTQTPDSPRSQGQHSPKGTQKRTYCKRTHGTPHPTFEGVKTSTAGVKHMTTHPDVKQIWSAYVMIPSQLKHKDVRMLFLGKNYWSAEAAARAVDRANIALHGREAASTNFPLEWYGPEEVQRTGDDLEKQLKALAGIKNNNPRNVPGVPYIKWQPGFIPTRNAQTLREQNPDWQPRRPKSMPSIDPAFALQLWEQLTGASASQAEAEGLQDPDVPWFNKVCGHCRPCRAAVKRKAQVLVPTKKGIQCTALPKLKAAKQHLSRMSTTSGQQRFAPADLDAFLASLPDTCTDSAPEDEGDPTPRGVDGSDAEDGGGGGVRLRHMGDVLFVPEERRGGVRQKGLSKGVRAGLKGKQRRVSPGLSEDSDSADEDLPRPNQLRRGRSHGLRHAERAVTWTDAQLATLQVREDALYEVQEQGRVLAADAAPHRGIYQPLLTAPPAGTDTLDRLKWPDYYAADRRHIQRCADKGKLVEVRNHDWWGAPALGMLGPPAAALQGSLGHQPSQQQSRSVGCCWCKAEDHAVKNCPLNAYLDEHMEGSPEQDTHLAQHAGARAEQLARAGDKEAPAEWLDHVSQPVKDVMSAVQQMASVGAQANVHKDSSHGSVIQSMTPNALLACGLLVDELMKSQLH